MFEAAVSAINHHQHSTVMLPEITLRVMLNEIMPPLSVIRLRIRCLVLNGVWVANSTAMYRSANTAISAAMMTNYHSQYW